MLTKILGPPWRRLTTRPFTLRPEKPKPLTRSEVMSRVKSKDTGPELSVRRAFWHAGLRYRLHDKSLPGKPDIVFPSRRTVVFVHGCFWHGHEGRARHRIPKTRSGWWAEKIARNKARDNIVRAALLEAGWTAIVVWECEIEKPSVLSSLVHSVASIVPVKPVANDK